MKKSICIILSIFSLQVLAQLNVTSSLSANTLVQTLTGTGVSINNLVLNCGSQAAGTFSYSGSHLGLSAGVLLTTGDAIDAANPESYFCSVTNGHNYSDTNLIAIGGSGAQNDACVLSFNFIPNFACVAISYIFGSEEYPDYVGSTFNDVFGIFLTGPNPDGGMYHAKNIGALPDGTPIEINNVNATTNSPYFIPNYTYNYFDIAYGGYTTPIMSVATVFPDSIYHMEIAIADNSDEAFDSGVFLSAYGISSASPPGPCLMMIQGTTGITHIAKENELQIFPNPATSVLQINSPNQSNSISIIDVLGNEVLKSEGLKWSNSGTQININSLQNGVYFIKVGNAIQKFVKQ